MALRKKNKARSAPAAPAAPAAAAAPDGGTPPAGATLRDIAERTGLALSTVSMALRRHPRISKATHKRVLAAARKAGYCANPLVTALMAQVRRHRRLQPSGEVLGFLTSSASEDKWREYPSLVDHWEGARRRALEQGFQMETFWLGTGGADSARINRILRARRIRAVIIAPVMANHKPFRLDWDNLAVVALQYSFRQVAVHRVAHHQTNGMYLCYRKLREHGYRKIGLALNCFDDERTHHYWRAGWLAAREVYGGEPVDLLCVREEFPSLGEVRDWLEQTKPDAVISPAGMWLSAIRKNGYAVPERIAYASLDVMPAQVGHIAGIWQDNRRIGANAVDILSGQLFRNETGLSSTPVATLIDGAWLDGPTV
ncbi:MAG: LacI family transcriptional regulator [Opitutaceae bacterium]|jgi:LacI family transcriptional regulator|nr:LacI family transcriptional regulator [Opitutaceae bacterium]